VRVLQRNSDLLQDLVDTRQHSIVPKPDDSVPARRKVLSPLRIVLRLFAVLSAIELDHNATLDATKVRDEWPDRMLAAELHAELVPAQPQPECRLRFRELSAQPLGSIARLDD
jgi:hypothetical protein